MTVTTSPKSAKCVRFKTNLWGNEKVGEKLFRDRNGVLFDLSPKVSPQRCHEDPDRVPSMASKVKHVHYDTSPILTQLPRDSEHENEKVNFESPALWERHRNRSPCDHDNSMFPRTCNVAPRRLQDSDDDDVDRDGAQALGKITQVRSSWTVPKRSHGWLNVEDEYFCTSEACEQKLHGSHRVWECQNVSATQELSYPSVVSTPRKNPSTRDTHGSGNAAHTSISMKGDLQMKHNRFTTGWTAKEEELKEILQSINQKLKTRPMSGKIHQDESRRKKTYSHPQRV